MNDDTRPTGPPRLNPRLTTTESTRRTFARALRLFDANYIDEQRFKALIYGLSQYLAVLKMVKDQEIDNRLSELERRAGIEKPVLRAVK